MVAADLCKRSEFGFFCVTKEKKLDDSLVVSWQRVVPNFYINQSVTSPLKREVIQLLVNCQRGPIPTPLLVQRADAFIVPLYDRNAIHVLQLINITHGPIILFDDHKDHYRIFIL